MNKLFTKQNTLRLILAVAFAGWLFVSVNVLFIDWTYKKSIYWGTARVTTYISHPFSIDPENSELDILNYYRYQGDDDILEFPSFYYSLDKVNSFSFNFTSAQIRHGDSQDYMNLFSISYGYHNDYRSLSISNKEGFPTIVKCHYSRLVSDCQSWNPSQDWSEFLIEG